MALTEKISVALGRDELQTARAAAKQDGVSLSAFVTGAVRARIEERRRLEAARQVMASFAPEDFPSEDEQRELLAQWSAPRVAAPGGDLGARGVDVGLTFHTGALIGLERRRHAIRRVFATAIENSVAIVVPAVVVAEWWRRGAHEKERAIILRAVRVEVLHEHVARLAGIAIGLVPGAGTIDAIVMASASLRGDTVYTSDPDDLGELRDRVPEFAAVQVLTA